MIIVYDRIGKKLASAIIEPGKVTLPYSMFNSPKLREKWHVGITEVEIYDLPYGASFYNLPRWTKILKVKDATKAMVMSLPVAVLKRLICNNTNLESLLLQGDA